MSDLHAKCPDCGRVWLVAELPMVMGLAAKLALAARCPCGSAKKPVLPNADDMHLFRLREKLAAINTVRRMAELDAKRVLEDILYLRRETNMREMGRKNAAEVGGNG